MNLYKFQATALCKADPKIRDYYLCELKTERMVRVEKLMAIVEGFVMLELFQEDLTLELGFKLNLGIGDELSMVGRHYNAEIITNYTQS